MSQTVIIILAILITLALTYGISMVLTRKKEKNQSVSVDDWEVGGRELPLYVVVGTQFATAMGGGILVGQVGNGFSNGFSVMLYGILCQLSFVILMFIAKWLRDHQFATVPEILLHYTGPSKVVRILAGIMTIVVPFGWCCSNLTAFAKLYTTITGIPINVLICVMAALCLLFVLPSGLKTVAWTDFIFGCLMLIVGTAVAIVTVNMAGGMNHIMTTVPAEIVELPGSLFSVGLSTTVLWIFSLTPGGLTNQMYYQRILACKDTNKVKKSLLISAGCALLAYVWAVIVGLGVRSMNPSLESEMATGWLMNEMPIWCVAIFSGLVVCTILSTISSGVQSVVVNLNRDIYRVLKPDVDEKKAVRISRVLSVAVLICAALLAMFFPQVLSLLVLTYSYSAAGLVCPIFLSYILRKKGIITKNGVIAGMVAGIVVCAVSMQFESVVPYVIWGCLASGVAMIVFSKLDHKNPVYQEL
ncbi:sodium:solute symporter family protein [Oscillibacter sp. MSJ-2]|uniref:Sodium:solute symporter family protein n=1 Tax=Dysosmobacter acutus TaxID=2841504 RepID=A0ABS6F5F1_9FIRM|nr:sodium:solute symporter family protein [Dysosmobacter acutus]MBU5625500.1 sodium:solute symporter family protein [Dysosmobacter acutus]